MASDRLCGRRIPATALKRLFVLGQSLITTLVHVTETRHVNEYRAVWLRELIAEMEARLIEPIPLQAICFCSVLSMPK
jgi:hypothetical protein